jgi:RNA polymerase primary sigma factor
MDRFPTLHEDRALGTYLREIAKVDLLTPEEEKALARAVQSGDEKALHRLVEANLRFVVSVAKNYRNRGLSFLDLINEGNLGLLRAGRTFDPERGVRFISYAVWWIRQAILSALLDKGDLVRIPQSQVKKMRKATKRIRVLEDRQGLPLTDAETLERTDLTREGLDDLKRFSQRYLSLDTTLVGEAEKPMLEMLRSDETVENLEKKLMDGHLSGKLKGLLKGLAPRDGQVLVWRYGLDGSAARTLDEIGKDLRISKERVRQIEERAVQKLRRSKGVEALRDFVA